MIQMVIISLSTKNMVSFFFTADVDEFKGKKRRGYWKEIKKSKIL